MAPKGKLLRWGILSAGRISNDFALALQTLPPADHTMYAVAARSEASAEAFASKFSIPKAYGSYDELLEDPDVDIIYVGAVNQEHVRLSRLCLAKGKAVLCEKPAAPSVKDFSLLVEDAKKSNVFFMEAVWTRCLPLYLDLQKRILAQEFGEIKGITCSFGSQRLLKVERIKNPIYQGGVMLDVGIYSLVFADIVYGGEEAESIHAVGNFDENGNDHTISVTMLYSGNRMAQLLISGGVDLPNSGFICGSKKTVQVASPFWCATKMTIGDEVVEFPFPELSGPTNFINSAGLRYEAEHARQCILLGKHESDLVPISSTLRILKYADIIRQQLDQQLAGK